MTQEGNVRPTRAWSHSKSLSAGKGGVAVAAGCLGIASEGVIDDARDSVDRICIGAISKHSLLTSSLYLSLLDGVLRQLGTHAHRVLYVRLYSIVANLLRIADGQNHVLVGNFGRRYDREIWLSSPPKVRQQDIVLVLHDVL